MNEGWISEKAKEEARSLLRQGVSYGKTAEKTDMSISTVARIARTMKLGAKPLRERTYIDPDWADQWEHARKRVLRVSKRYKDALKEENE